DPRGSTMTGASSCTVYHDGACPLCRREIAFYRQRAGANAIRWVDVADADNADLGPGLDSAQAISRFHVRLGNGQLRSGAAGFAALWSALPGFRWAGRIAGAPPIRPWLQRRVSDGSTIARPFDR
ncbi:MAG: thiol-disulfide oxidoreductase DCC family protein, partial [Alphaproteobacteria bacterium]